MATSRQRSLSTIELEIDQASWELKSNTVAAAEVHLKNNNVEAAKDLCSKGMEGTISYDINKGEPELPGAVLDRDAQFFPAKKLQKEIKQIEEAAEDTESEESSSSEDEAFDAAPESPPPLRRPGSASTPARGILRKGNVEVLERSMSTITTRNTEENSRHQSRKSIEASLNKVLVQAHGRIISPTEMLEKVNGLRHKDGDFACPFKGCGRGYDFGHEVVSHYLRRHFSELRGKPIRPFYCKTCLRESFTVANHLVVHGREKHPTCRWLAGFEDQVKSAR